MDHDLYHRFGKFYYVVNTCALLAYLPFRFYVIDPSQLQKEDYGGMTRVLCVRVHFLTDRACMVVVVVVVPGALERKCK